MIIQKPSTPGRFATYLALGSFGIGTLFLTLHLSFPRSVIIISSGYAFVLSALVINFTTLLYLFYLLIGYWQERQTIVIRMLILVSNVPFYLLYLNVVSQNNPF